MVVGMAEVVLSREKVEGIVWEVAGIGVCRSFSGNKITISEDQVDGP